MDGRHKAGHDGDKPRQQIHPRLEPLASDGGAAIAAGNGRVVRARLSDARHFWLTDLAPLPDYKDKAAKPLDQRLAKLEALGIVFHEKLGTQAERIERIESLARELAPKVGADVELAARAAQLAKADLVTEMVGEFPELQGLMGRYYALAQGEEPSVADAIEEHYKPQGPNDRIPTAPVSIAVALADKLDTLARLLGDRREADRQQGPVCAEARGARRHPHRARKRPETAADRPAQRGGLGRAARHRIRPRGPSGLCRPVARTSRLSEGPRARGSRRRVLRAARRSPAPDDARVRETTASLLAFFADRLKVYLRDKGARHDLIDAVFALPGQDDLLMIVWRVEALGRLLDTEDGKNLLAGYRRAANILRAEEKKDGAGAFDGAHDPAKLVLPAEKDLADVLAAAGAAARERVAREDFEGAMRALAASARARRRLLPRRDRQRRRSGAPPQPPAAARRTARRDACGRGFFQGRGIGAVACRRGPKPVERRASIRTPYGPRQPRSTIAATANPAVPLLFSKR